MLVVSDTVVPIISSGLVILTLYLGIHGLGREYRTGEDQKLTKSGRHAAGWMGIAAILAISSIVVGAQLSAQKDAETTKKEKREAAERDARFKRQMVALTGATSRLELLQGDMTISLKSQQGLFKKSDDNLRLSASLGDQARVNAAKLLTRMFNDSNRVSADRIAVIASVNCAPLQDRKSNYPTIDSVALNVSIGGRSRISFKTTRSLALEGGSIFYGFLGDIGLLEQMENWRQANINFVVTGETGFGESIGILGDFNDLTPAEWAEKTRPSSKPAGCPIKVSLLLNGRTVLTASGELQQERPGAYSYIGRMANLKVDSTRMPTMTQPMTPK